MRRRSATAAVALAARFRASPMTVVAIALAGAAALVKLTSAVYLMPVVVLSLPEGRLLTRGLLGRLALGGAAALGALSWYLHARELETPPTGSPTSA